MQIIICGHHQALNILAEIEPIDVIFISSPYLTYSVNGSENIQHLAKNCCTLLFNDVTILRNENYPPQIEDVQKALEFSKDKDRILISCQAGISRSSAIAYLVGVQKVGSVEAFRFLNSTHIPNSLIIKHGAHIFNDSKIIDLMNFWKERKVT
jgi:predicted protein tyrosine phosphatase